MMIFDSHTHLFSPGIIANVAKLNGLAAVLALDIDKARGRTDTAILKREAETAGVRGCLLLPTAPVNGIHRTNEFFLKTVEGEEGLVTAGTLHPSASGIDEELGYLNRRGVRALKFSSFSQKFDLTAEETFALFEKVGDHNLSGKPRFFVILDTFNQADIYFGAPREYLTTPEKLGRLVACFPEIAFVGAHMGGLAAPIQEIERHLPPQNNLYLDTSNAAHVLTMHEFLHLLELHGPDRILFGTDWPWFGHQEEIALIRDLLNEAGFSASEQSRVFGGNISQLLGR
jgi:uncharacterized protein